MMNFLSHRSTEIEIMDDLSCKGSVVEQTLKELAFINRWLGGNKVTLGGIQQLLSAKYSGQEIRITDIGCGGGDILKQIAAWGVKRGFNLKLMGIDANPYIVEFAKAQYKALTQIDFKVQNVESREFQESETDIYIATLFTHHFSNDQLTELFQIMHKQSRIGVVINDLHRHWIAYCSIWILTRLFSRSRMVKFDAPLSVRRSFSRGELGQILHKAGINNYSLRWKWAFRWQLIIPSSLA